MTSSQLKRLGTTFFDKAGWLSDLATRLYTRREYDDAAKLWMMCVEFAPERPEVYHNLGVLFTQAAEHQEARGMFMEAMERSNHAPMAMAAYAESSRKCGLPLVAIQYAEKAIKAKESTNQVVKSALTTTAAAKHDCGEDPRQWCNMILALDKDDKQANLNLILVDMEHGNWAKNWAGYSKWLGFSQNQKTQGLDQSGEWNGSPLSATETLLVICDQGSGDSMQMGSLVFRSLLVGMGRVVLYTQRELVTLMQNNFGDLFAEVHGFGQAPKDLHFDKFVTLLGLMNLAKVESTSDLTVSGRLKATDEKVAKWDEKIQSGVGLKIGLSWAGDPSHGNDFNRSMKLSDFDGVDWPLGSRLYSLQVGHATKQLASRESIVDLGREFKDFSDTAAAIQDLDVVITVDTAIAHLAGCLGKKTIVLLPFAYEWRWIVKDERTPWYPDTTCLVQGVRGDWSKPLVRMRELL